MLCIKCQQFGELFFGGDCVRNAVHAQFFDCADAFGIPYILVTDQCRALQALGMFQAIVAPDINQEAARQVRCGLLCGGKRVLLE